MCVLAISCPDSEVSGIKKRVSWKDKDLFLSKINLFRLSRSGEINLPSFHFVKGTIENVYI